MSPFLLLGFARRYMGYSIRTSSWRYTEWAAWDGALLKPRWNVSAGVELYDHAADPPESSKESSELGSEPRRKARGKGGGALFTREEHTMLRVFQKSCVFLNLGFEQFENVNVAISHASTVVDLSKQLRAFFDGH